VRPSGVIVSFNIFKHRQLQFVKSMVCPAAGFFPLEILEKALTNCIVKGIAFLGKGLHNIQRIQKLAECKGSILCSAV
jgi:hypothetical protein